MRKIIKLFSLLASFALAGCFTPALADTAASAAATPTATPAPTPVVTVDGLVDTYYSYNFNKTIGANPFGNAFYNFNTANNSFTLSLAEVNINAKMGEGSANVDLISGSTVGFLGLPYGIIRQAYVEWATGNLTVDMGQFVTHMGQEVIESTSNWNYSHSLLFSYAIPYFHTGLRATYAFDPKFSASGYVYDGWNQGIAGDTNGSKTYGWMLMGVPDPSLTIMFNGIWGPVPNAGGAAIYGVGAVANGGANRFVGEVVVDWSATDKLSFEADYNYGSDDAPSAGVTGDIWKGLAVYARYQLSSSWAIALRGEDYIDTLGLTVGVPTANGLDMKEGTLTLENTISSNLVLRLEGRYDVASDAKGLGTSPVIYSGNANQLTSTLGAVYKF